MTEIIAGVRVRNSRLVDDVTELICSTTSALIFHHSRRVFLFGSLQARRLHIEPDPPDELEHSCPASTASTSSTSSRTRHGRSRD